MKKFLKVNITCLLIILLINMLSAASNEKFNIIPISELKKNDSSGVPLLIGQSVTVTGKVTISDQLNSPSAIQDSTSGLAVYDFNFMNSVNIGDSVVITGVVDQYSGLTELKNITLNSKSTDLLKIVPEVVTCYDISNDGKSGIEKYEGKLVRIDNVSVNTNKWTVTTSGNNFTLTDATGFCDIRIDKDTNIANTLTPSGDFSVVGVVMQYDPSSPHTSGYQLMPRSIDDIIAASGPMIINEPIENNITSNSMDIIWQTAAPANSILMYGETDSYEIDTLIISDYVTDHIIEINSLNPATIYHIKIGSEDNLGTTYSGDNIVISSSEVGSTGEINVYFNKSIDTSYAYIDNFANGMQNLELKFIDRILAADSTIDICFYSWNMENITDALIYVYNQGVKVRFIYDSGHDQYQVTRLKNAGITVIDDAFGLNDTKYKIQHNKFAIFDGHADSNPANDWVWTGSLNLTDYGDVGVNAFQNVVEIQDQSLAKAYTIEFNEMWGSESDDPDPNKSRFGKRKTDNTPHKFNINGIPVEMYMSPTDYSTSKIIDAIKTADYEIYFSILTFTRIDVKLAMQDKFENIDNFKVRGVFDKNQSELSQYYSMSGTGDYPWSSPADVWLDNEFGVLHHKYMIVDAEHENSHPIVITGSQNWSSRGEGSNDENTLIIHDALIANQYLQEFAERYHAAGGTGDFLTTKVAHNDQSLKLKDYTLSQNYPNPFNINTTFQFTLNKTAFVQLEIYNIQGRFIERIVNNKLSPNVYNIKYDASNLATGIYFYQLKYNNQKSEIKKFIIIK